MEVGCVRPWELYRAKKGLHDCFGTLRAVLSCCLMLSWEGHWKHRDQRSRNEAPPRGGVGSGEYYSPGSVDRLDWVSGRPESWPTAELPGST